MEPGLRIVSIDGQPVESNAEIDALVGMAARRTGDPEFTVALGVAADGETVADRSMSVPMRTRTDLVNGLSFLTEKQGERWRTTVATAPDGSNFLVGDAIVAYMATGERLGATLTFKDILERELASGTTHFSFVVERKGEMWVEMLNLAALAN